MNSEISGLRELSNINPARKFLDSKIGSQVVFAKRTGLSHETIRQWPQRGIIPWLLAEFICLWFDISLLDLVSEGVKITYKIRTCKETTFLMLPSRVNTKDEKIRLLARALRSKNFVLIYLSRIGKGVRKVPISDDTSNPCCEEDLKKAFDIMKKEVKVLLLPPEVDMPQVTN